jgi:hypothetical protein
MAVPQKYAAQKEQKMEDKAAYLDWMKYWAAEDKKSVLLLIVFDLGTASLILSKGSANAIHFLRSLGLVCLLMSAASFYFYVHRLHLVIRQLCPLGEPLEPARVDAYFANFRSAHISWYRYGCILMAFGLVLLIFALWSA